MSLGWFKSQKTVKLLKRSGSYSEAAAKSPACLFMGKIPVTLAYINGGRKMIGKLKCSFEGKLNMSLFSLMLFTSKIISNLVLTLGSLKSKKWTWDISIWDNTTKVHCRKTWRKTQYKVQATIPSYYIVKFSSKIPLAQL